MWTALTNFTKAWWWSFLGVLLALIFGGLTLYDEFIADKHPTLQFDVLSNASVLDLREKVPNLSVHFEGVDISKQGLSLRVFTVRVSNNSSKDILRGFYDDRAPLGIKISNGKFIETSLITASNPYLRENAKISKLDDQTLIFPDNIIESGQSFVVKLLVLHPQGDVPALTAIGKIAGIKSIPVKETFLDSTKETFVATTFQGNVWVQVARTVSYFLLFLFATALALVPVAIIGDFLGKKARKKSVQRFKNATTNELEADDDKIFNLYVESEGYLLQRIEKAFHSARNNTVKRRRGRPPEYLIRGAHAGIIHRVEEGFQVTDHTKTILQEFLAFLKDENLLSNNFEMQLLVDGPPPSVRKAST